MPEYYVQWGIALDADSPRHAAQIARAIQRDSSSLATVFDVADMSTMGTPDEFWESIDVADEAGGSA
jgi:hypothetical protein